MIRKTKQNKKKGKSGVGDRSFTRQDFRRVIKPLENKSKIFMKTMIQPIFSGFIMIFMASLLKNIITAIQEGDVQMSKKMLFIFIFVGFLQYLLFYRAKYNTWAITYPELFKILYDKTISRFLESDNNSIEKIGTGRLIEIISKGVGTRTDFVSEILIRHTQELATVVAAIISFLVIDPLYSLILVIISIFYFFFLKKTEVKKNIRREERKTYFVEQSRHLVKVLMAKFEILQNNRAYNEIKLMKERFHKVYLVNRHVHFRVAVQNIVSAIIKDGIKVAAIAFIGMGIRLDKQNIPEFVSIITILYIYDGVISKLAFAYMMATRKMIDIKKLRSFLDQTQEIQGYKTGKEFIYQKGNIEIKNLNFFYDEKSPIFTNFNLQIQGGKRTALVGMSGSGKSTLVKLIAGYLTAQSGTINIDNQSLPIQQEAHTKTKKSESKTTKSTQKQEHISLKSYYPHIGYLTQEPSIFDGSVRENLTYGIDEKKRTKKEKEEKMKQKIEKAIKQAQCQFIYDLPKGLETEIGERGIRLSGGQRQRLAIAKIFIKDPEIIILDEPTSALDSFSEDNITKAMHSLFENRTVIIIAHRLQTVKQADEIIVLGNTPSQVIEKGTHHSLIEKNGEYAQLLELQSNF